MTDIAREKFRALMAEIDDLEGKIDDLEKECKALDADGEPGQAQTVRQELNVLNEKLVARRNELARVSDGCGRSHDHTT